MRKSLFILAILLVAFIFIPENAEAQCAMCKAVPESAQNGIDQDITGGGINKGILYIIAIPYILILGFGFYFFRNKLKPFFINLGIIRE